MFIPIFYLIENRWRVVDGSFLLYLKMNTSFICHILLLLHREILKMRLAFVLLFLR
jgi:hypothetical protein